MTTKLDQRVVAAGFPHLKLRYKYTQGAVTKEREEVEHQFDWYNTLGCLDPDCKFHARPKQYPPDWGWFIWCIRTGRKWGKTRTAAEYVIDQAKNGGKRWIALVSDTAADVRDIMIEGESGILTISPPWFRPNYEPSKRRITWPNGAQASTYSAEDPEQLRGPGHDLAWCDELAKWKRQREAWNNLMFGLTLGEDPHCIVTTTPRPTPLVKELSKRKGTDVALVLGHTDENLDNLAPSVVVNIIQPYEGTRTGRQELAGEILEDVEGALWSLAAIDGLRVNKPPGDLVKCATAIDPSGSSEEGASLQGIVTAGTALCSCKGKPEIHGFVLADNSGHYTPEGWARVAIGALDKWDGDRIIAEKNYGGDMVKATLNAVDPNVSYKGVTATRGKVVRAEPIAALYEQCKVHHVGVFPDLEEQLTNWTPADKSPDRLDALVWALTYLMIRKRSIRAY